MSIATHQPMGHDTAIAGRHTHTRARAHTAALLADVISAPQNSFTGRLPHLDGCQSRSVNDRQPYICVRPTIMLMLIYLFHFFFFFFFAALCARSEARQTYRHTFFLFGLFFSVFMTEN